jgi:hypothetical protein
MEKIGDRSGKMEGYCLIAQSPQWGVVPMEEEVSFKVTAASCAPDYTKLTELKMEISQSFLLPNLTNLFTLFFCGKLTHEVCRCILDARCIKHIAVHDDMPVPVAARSKA